MHLVIIYYWMYRSLNVKAEHVSELGILVIFTNYIKKITIV